MDAKIINEMPLPMPRCGKGGDDHEHRNEREVGDELLASLAAERAEQEDVADRLREREADGQKARVLRDLGLADFAFLLQLLERRYDDRQKLQDDR